MPFRVQKSVETFDIDSSLGDHTTGVEAGRIYPLLLQANPPDTIHELFEPGEEICQGGRRKAIYYLHSNTSKEKSLVQGPSTIRVIDSLTGDEADMTDPATFLGISDFEEVHAVDRAEAGEDDVVLLTPIDEPCRHWAVAVQRCAEHPPPKAAGQNMAERLREWTEKIFQARRLVTRRLCAGITVYIGATSALLLEEFLYNLTLRETLLP